MTAQTISPPPGSAAGTHPERETGLEFDLGRAVHWAMLTTMTASVTSSLAPFVGLLVAVPVGVALTYTFGRLIKQALAIEGDHDQPASLVQRLAAGLGAVLIAGFTIGAASATLYRVVFGAASALHHLEVTQEKAQIAIDKVIGNANAAARALEAWKQASALKAETEARSGGTCPERAATLGKPGPIAAFRREEASVAADLAAEVGSAIKSLEVATKAIPKQRPADFAGALDAMGRQNAAITASNAFSQGSAISSAIEALKRREGAQIRWIDGSAFSCGDAARLELIAQARQALEVIKAGDALSLLKPGIDLGNPREVAVRGLLRAFNSIAMLMTFGKLGSFEDDVLMKLSLKANGPISRETLSMFLAALVEAGVIASAVFARPAHPGSKTPFPFQPAPLLAWLDDRARQSKRLRSVTLHLVSSAIKAALNFVATVRRAQPAAGSWSIAPASAEDLDSTTQPLRCTRQFDTKYLVMGRELEPWVYYLDGTAIVAVPRDHRAATESVRDCLRILEYTGLCRPVVDEVPGRVLARLPEFERRYRDNPGSLDQSFQVAVLGHAFAHALCVERHESRTSPGAQLGHPKAVVAVPPLEIFH